MPAILLLLFLLSSSATFAQTTPAADPVFQTKVEREAARKKADEDASAVREAAAKRRDEELAAAKKAEEQRREALRIEAEKKRAADQLATEAKKKGREEAAANLRQAYANEQAAPGEEEKPVEFPERLDRRGKWRPYQVTGTRLNLAGERLREIAQRKEMTIPEIQKGNPFFELDELIPAGEFAWVWEVGPRPTQPEIKAGDYVVRPGDTGAKIAAKHGMTIGDLHGLNPETNLIGLRPGQKVRVKASVASASPATLGKEGPKQSAPEAAALGKTNEAGAGSKTLKNDDAPRPTTTNEQRIFEVADVDRAPLVRRKVPPQYPLALRRDGVTGKAEVEFVVDTNGGVSAATCVSSTNPQFDALAVASIKSWLFRPGQKGGRDVPVRLRETVIFENSR